jgi:hypothetical protein
VHGVEAARPAAEQAAQPTARGIFSACANPRCATGWLRLWRSRRTPGFESRWACSAECMGELVSAALRREMDRGGTGPHANRLPIGLMLLERGRITADELRAALEEQRRASGESVAGENGEARRLGEWLVARGVLDETALTRALGAQWSCPVLPLDAFSPEETASALPRFLAEAAGALPLRVAGGKLLYLAFSGGIDRGLTAALGPMTGLQVVAGIAPDSEFHRSLRNYLEAPAPRARFLEAGSSGLLARALTKLVESEKPVEARLRRVHGWFWLRMWRRLPAPAGLPGRGEVDDTICAVGREDGGEP